MRGFGRALRAQPAALGLRQRLVAEGVFAGQPAGVECFLTRPQLLLERRVLLSFRHLSRQRQYEPGAQQHFSRIEAPSRPEVAERPVAKRRQRLCHSVAAERRPIVRHSERRGAELVDVRDLVAQCSGDGTASLLRHRHARLRDSQTPGHLGLGEASGFSGLLQTSVAVGCAFPAVKMRESGIMTTTAERLTAGKMLIDGQGVDAQDGRVIDIENPATRRAIAQVPRGGEADVDRAVQAAARAFDGWRMVPALERGRLLLKIAAAVEAETESIARTVALETGNAIRTQARPEVKSTADVFRYFGGVAGEVKGETIPLGEHVLCYTRREPIGVVGGIVPWNAPVVLGTLKIAMAVAAGNTLVLKAAEDAPLGLLRVAELCGQHLPAGVVNLVTGYGEEAGAALARHPLVRKLSFTGSTEVGRLIMHAAADRIVPVSLELGGKSPAIVFPDANDEKTLDGVITGMRFTRQGQSCTAGSRLFLHRGIFDSFLDRLSATLATLKIGDPTDETTDMGAIINRKQFDRVCSYIKDGLGQSGARVVLGGLPPKEGPLAEGYFVQPTVFAGVRNEWRIAREEIFGPVLVAIPWDDEREVVRMANDSHYGLAAYVWTHDITRGLRTAHAIESGWVQVNQGLGQFPGQSYGGFKQSGIGREYSLEGMLDSYTQRKSVTVNLQ